MAYTIEGLDGCLRSILGDRVFANLVDEDGTGRVSAHQHAVIRAFTRRMDDADTDLLREAWLDVQNTGAYRPAEGWEDGPPPASPRP